jgi:hypothetical protein
MPVFTNTGHRLVKEVGKPCLQVVLKLDLGSHGLSSHSIIGHIDRSRTMSTY